MFTTVAKNDDRHTHRRCVRRYFHAPAAGWVAPTVRKRAQGSWRPDTSPAGKLPCWTSKNQWLLTVRCVLATADGEDIRARWAVKTDTVIAVAKIDANTADADTGRNVATAHATVARVLGCSDKTVQRARNVLRDLELAVEVVRGRYLSTAERIQVSLTTGARQWRIASTRHLILPRKHRMLEEAKSKSEKNVHLPRRGSDISTSSSSVVTKNARRRGLTHEGNLQTQKLAGKLASRLPWLARGMHIGHLVRLLVAAGIDPERTTAAKIIASIEAAGFGWLDVRSQKNPLGWFAAGLRKAGDRIYYSAAPTPAEAAPGVRQKTCTDPACDGFGWHNQIVDGRPVASRCPVGSPGPKNPARGSKTGVSEKAGEPSEPGEHPPHQRDHRGLSR